MPDFRYEILVDKLENPRKCTIHPLRGRPDVCFRYFSGNKPIPAFQADCLLHIDGRCLSEVERGSLGSLGLIDCTWKKVPGVLQRLEKPLPRLVRIPSGFETAYPRQNKQGLDPSGGLATVEALFIAAAFLGFWDESLLEKYYFKQAFLERNQAAWEKYRLRR
jgi:pre-rRNA-processing protein TSR3